MSLVPEYASSSSEDEHETNDRNHESARSVSHSTVQPATAQVVSASSSSFGRGSSNSSNKNKHNSSMGKSPKQPKPKRKRQTLFLPPEIQRLLERGTNHSSSSSEGEEDNNGFKSSTSKKRKAPKKGRGDLTQPENSALAFLPAPKNSYVTPSATTVGVSSSNQRHGTTQQHQNETLDTTQLFGDAHQAQQGSRYTAQHATEPAPVAYAQGYPHDYVYGPAQQMGDASMDSRSSKAARNRERELERALQQGQFDQVAHNIIEVQGPAADAWEAPPPDQFANKDDVKVTASFWNSRAGTKVASAKPSRLQRQRHQLNQLAFDAKMREVELLNQRGQSIKTKRETQAKYGW